MSGVAPLKELLGRRASHRLSVVLPAMIRLGELNFTAKLTNIGRGGAKLETSASLVPGAEVTFCCGTIVAAGRVAWRNAGFLGVDFAARLSDAQVQEQVSRSAAVAALRGSAVSIGSAPTCQV